MEHGLSLGFLDAKFYESINRYLPNQNYKNIATSICNEGYYVRSLGFWTSMTPRNYKLKESGWKIHISSLPAFAEETLRRALPLLAESRVAFKFCSDERMLRMSLNKNWPRQQAGKFITVYPNNDEDFKKLTLALSEELAGFDAPRILSDRQYSKSSPVYYRYGEHVGVKRRDDEGRLLSGYHLNGIFIEDNRGIYAPTPKGVIDPFINTDAQPAPQQVILNNKYRVTGVLKFSALGGIYKAESLQDASNLIIREARAQMGYGKSIESSDPFHVIKNEAAILKRMDGLEVTPGYVDFFIEEGHAFLVQEKVNGESFWAKAVSTLMNNNLGTVGLAWNAFTNVFADIAESLHVVHAHGVVLRDVTRTNVIITPDHGVKFIDLEFAFDVSKSDEGWLKGFTPGYGSPEQRKGSKPTFFEDYYAYGALIVEMLTMCAAGLELNALGVLKKLEQNLIDLGFPSDVLNIVSDLLDENPLKRLTPIEASSELQALMPVDSSSMIPHHVKDGCLTGADTVDKQNIERILVGIDVFFEEYADFDRTDRLWPVSAQGFIVHPGALDYGALGPAFYLSERDKLTDSVIDWVTRSFTSGQPPSGLMSGYAGLALFFGSISDKPKALSALNEASKTLPSSSGLFYGSAGIGLVALHLYMRFRDPVFLDHASKVANSIASRCTRKGQVCWWPNSQGTAPIGLGRGASGIALFLLFHGLATSSGSNVDLALSALKHDMSLAVNLSGYTLFQPTTNSNSNDPNSPHLLYGAAGVGAVAARFLKVFPGDEDLIETVNGCAFAIRQRLTNKFWQYHGLSGTGEYAMDLNQLGIARDDNLPLWIAQGISPLEYRMGNGAIAFPGEGLIKLCGDYAMGTAGIGMFMNRVQRNSDRFLFLDQLLA